MPEQNNLQSLLQQTVSLLKSTQKPLANNRINTAIPPTSSGFGLSVLQRALADVGVTEDLGKNDGRRIREYFSTFNTSSGQNWCAAAVSTWMNEAGGGPIPGSLGAKEIARQFENIRKWIPREKLKAYHLSPGNIAVWHRGDSKSWTGHIGVINSSNGESFTSVEANSGPQSNAVVINPHNIRDNNLLGVGILSDHIPESTNSKINYLDKLSARYHGLCLTTII